jgi:hypothetical protein
MAVVTQLRDTALQLEKLGDDAGNNGEHEVGALLAIAAGIYHLADAVNNIDDNRDMAASLQSIADAISLHEGGA